MQTDTIEYPKHRGHAAIFRSPRKKILRKKKTKLGGKSTFREKHFFDLNQ